MCKIACIAGIKPENKDAAWQFVFKMAEEMSAPKSAESDGFGFSAIDSEGNLFGERWFHNNQAFRHHNVYGSEKSDELMTKFKILTMPKVYSRFGNLTDDLRSITLHSRTSTNVKDLKNVHPFVEGFTSVIHNGVIYNDDKFVKKHSTCDSEVILHEYIKLNIRNKIFKVKKLVNKLEGYYAMGIYSKMDNGTVILDVLRDDHAKLKAYFVKELDTLVFATPRFNGSAVEDACKSLGFTILSETDVKSNKLQRFDAISGEVIGFESFKPKTYVTKTYNNKETTYYGGYENYSKQSQYYENYYKAFGGKSSETKKESSNNVIELPTRSSPTEKELQAALDRDLEEILISSKEYTEAEIKELNKKYLPDVTKQLEKIVTEFHDAESFNDNGDLEWSMDEKFAWTKKG